MKIYCFVFRHDFDKDHGGREGPCDRLGLMSYNPDRPDSWTDCSKKDFEDWYRSKGHACLEEEVSCVSCGDTRRVSGCQECVGEGLKAHGAVLCQGDCRWHQSSCGPLSTGSTTTTTTPPGPANIFFLDIPRTICDHFNIMHSTYQISLP